jgi:DNA-binding NarL/FixJ family response regulator
LPASPSREALVTASGEVRADELCLSERTVATYRARLGTKLGLCSNVEIARYAMQHKLVD